MLSEYIARLVEYGIRTGLVPECERIYTTNLLLDKFGEKEYILGESRLEEKEEQMPLEEILQGLLREAGKRNLMGEGVTQQDLFDTGLMNCLVPRPVQVQQTFWEAYKSSPIEATNYFYKLSQDSNYIRRYRIAKDEKWTVDSKYGVLDITINLSKPEKDPIAIAAAGKQESVSYPKCQLCMENEGYAGRLDHPARQNHRVIPVGIDGGEWGFQYSPYVYYNEHCIVFNSQHVPMKIDEATFRKLFDFVKQFPHYFVGSNADLPIVGGSILSHDHFQGGNYEFAMARAPIEIPVTIKGFEDVEAGILKWPLSVLRIRHLDADRLISLAAHVLDQWKNYTDEEAFIYARTEGTPHNTITPIARKSGEMYELDLTLRNNITTKEHPLGVFHPHKNLHHIKKENIGLIEVMGLAVLPARLKREMLLMKDVLISGKNVREVEELKAHHEWLEELIESRKKCNQNEGERDFTKMGEEQVMDILRMEVGKVFVQVLEDAGVFKCDESGRKAFLRFVEVL